jgi:DNA-binding transcriptional LysR family regulator
VVGNECAIATPRPLTVDGSHAAIAFGLCGAGIVYATEAALSPHLDSGALQPILGDWASAGSGFHAYYSGRRHLPTGLRLLIDLIKEMQPLRS